MKKIFSIITVLVLILAACSSGDFVGGRYFGTFENAQNHLKEDGNMSFKHIKADSNYLVSHNQQISVNLLLDSTYFFMNELVVMNLCNNADGSGSKYETVEPVEGSLLTNLLETMPALDSLDICDEGSSIVKMTADAEFVGNFVKANLTFFTYTGPDTTQVKVVFMGNND